MIYCVHDGRRSLERLAVAGAAALGGKALLLERGTPCPRDATLLIFYWWPLVRQWPERPRGCKVVLVCNDHVSRRTGPTAWVQAQRQADLVLVCNPILVDEMKGRAAPVELQRDGIDPEAWPLDAEPGSHAKPVLGWVGDKRAACKRWNYVRHLARREDIEVRVADGQIPPDQMAAWYAGLDGILCVSESEGTCLPILEAGACGVPYVSTQVGCVPEVHAATGAGVVMPSRLTPDGMEAAVDAFLAARAHWRRWGRSLAAHVRQAWAADLSPLVRAVSGLGVPRGRGAPLIPVSWVMTEGEPAFRAGPLASDPVVVVSVAVRDVGPDLLDRALASVLDQGPVPVVAVVGFDGQDPGDCAAARLADPRVIVVRTPDRHGPYLHHHAALTAAPDDALVTIHDADDYSDPGRLSRLIRTLRRTDADACFGPVVEHRRGEGLEAELRPTTTEAMRTRSLTHPFDHFGLYRADFARRLGYYHGTMVGADTLTVSLCARYGRCAVEPRSQYHRVHRDGSLTASPETGFRTQARLDASRALAGIYARCRSLSDPAAVAAVLDAARAPVAQDLAKQARKIRRKMAAAVAAARAAAAESVTEAYRAAMGHAPWTAWSMTPEAVDAVWQDLLCRRPACIVEMGPGASTLALAAYARASHEGTGRRVEVVALEHDQRWLTQTAQALRAAGLDKYVDLRLAPLVDGCYLLDPIPAAPVDYVLIDGPPASVGRHRTLDLVTPCLSSAWAGVMHDAARDVEAAILSDWRDRLGVRVAVDTASDERGLAMLRCAP